MKNWLGQDIVPDAVVYRGAREGDSSSYRIGRVVKVNEVTNKVTVEWLYEPMGRYAVRELPQKEQDSIEAWVRGYSNYGGKNTSTCGIESIVLAKVDLEWLAEVAERNAAKVEKSLHIARSERDRKNLTRTY